MKNGKYILAILICFLLSSVNSHAQQLERKVALSAYIYNFAKNILWQNEDAIKEFHFLVIGQDEEIVQEMKKLSSRKLRNKSIKVFSALRLKDFSNVNLIFLLNGKDEDLARVFDLVEGKNILLVSDNYKDERVMMINFYDTENGTLRFKINKPNIINQHLRIMDDMILLGGTEIDVANLYHEAQQSLRELQKHSDLLEGNLAQLEKTIAEKNKEVQISKDSLLSQTLRIQSQQNVLLNQGVLLKQRESELLLQDEHIMKQQQLSTLQTQRLNKLSKNLDEGNRVYEKQKKDILRQRSEIDAQARILRNQGQTINRQRYVVFSLFTLIVMVAVIVFSILRNYKVKKKLAIELENRVMERTNDLNLLNEQLKVELAERKLAEESLRISEERYRYLFEQNPANMLIYDYQTLQLLAVNEAFVKDYGYTINEALSMYLPDLYPEEEKVSITKLARKISGYSYAGEWHHVKKDGTAFPIIATSHDAIFMGKDCRIAVLTDVTKLKQAEEKIQKMNQVLEDRVAERTAQLVNINKELETFSYSISHDLRAPLRAILGFSQILLNRHRDSMNEEGQQYMGYIVEASIRMEQLINDLLNYSRLGRKDINLRPIPLGDILSEIYQDFKQRLEEIGGVLVRDEAYPVLMGDESLFRQIFTNLIENAVTYRRLDVNLEIRVHCESGESSTRIKVVDNGIGIPEEYSEKIFNIFQRLHSEEEYPGTGIGLATVRKSVSMLKGKIWVESVVGEGSTFIIELPNNKMID